MPNVAEQLKNIKAECKPITDVTNFMRRALNRAQKKIQRLAPKGGWIFLFQFDYELEVEEGVSEYGLSPLVDTSKIVNFWDPTNENYINPTNRMEFLINETVNDSTGNPLRYVFKGFWPVQKQPPAASTLTLTNSDIGDSYNVKIQGIDADGLFASENLAISGTTPSISTNTYKKILALYKDEKSDGILTVQESATSVVLIKIAPNSQSVSCPVVEFLLIPASDDTLKYDFSMRLPEINDDDDVSLIPEIYHDAMEDDAKSQVYKTLEKWTQAKICDDHFNETIAIMKADFYIPKGIISPQEFRGGANRLPPQFGNNPVVTE